MSVKLDKMLYNMSLKNKKILKPLELIALIIGLDIRTKSELKWAFNPINISLIVLASLGLGAQYHYIWENRSKSMLKYTDAVCTSLQTLISFNKIFNFSRRQNVVHKLIQTAQNSEILQNLEIFELNLKNKLQIMEDIKAILIESWQEIKRQLNFYSVCVFGIVIWYYLSCIAMNIYNTHNNDNISDVEMLFPFQASFPMWRDKGMQFPYYFIEYVVVGSELHISGMTAISLAGIYIVNSIHAIAILRILNVLLDHSTSDNVLPSERTKYLLAWTRLHQKTYEYCNEVNSLYYIQSLPLFFVSMLVICLLIFQLSVGLGTDLNLVIQMCLYFSAATFEVFMYCFNGQRVTTESERLPVNVYNCKWYDENAEFKFIIQMLVMKTNRSISFKVGGFTTMSLVTLLAILRSSCSYCLLLREVDNK